MTPTLTEEIADLRALMAKATPGPWESFSHDTGYAVRAVYQRGECRVTAYPVVCAAGAQPNDVNAELVASMRNALPALLDAAERAERAEARVKELEATNAFLEAFVRRGVEALKGEK